MEVVVCRDGFGIQHLETASLHDGWFCWFRGAGLLLRLAGRGGLSREKPETPCTYEFAMFLRGRLVALLVKPPIARLTTACAVADSAFRFAASAGFVLVDVFRARAGNTCWVLCHCFLRILRFRWRAGAVSLRVRRRLLCFLRLGRFVVWGGLLVLRGVFRIRIWPRVGARLAETILPPKANVSAVGKRCERKDRNFLGRGKGAARCVCMWERVVMDFCWCA